MKQYRWALARWAICCLTASLLVGCMPPLKGKFQPEGAVPEGKALVYIYRLAKQNDYGLEYYPLKANGATVVRMYAGGYYPYHCRPGRVRFSAQGEYSAFVTADIAAGQTYYLKLYLIEGARMGTPALEMVDPETGLAELARCQLIVEKKEAGF
jgi:hypothetical protein